MTMSVDEVLTESGVNQELWMPVEEFEEIVIGLAHRNGRKLQILNRTGAGPDHPVMSNCPESRYLKVLWSRVW